MAQPMAEESRTPIVPVAKGIYLCDYVFDYENGKTDLYGLFNAIRPASYPHMQGRFCVFAQLVNGLGQVPFFIDIRDATNKQLIYTTQINQVSFPDRNTVVQLAVSMSSVFSRNRGCTSSSFTAIILGYAIPTCSCADGRKETLPWNRTNQRWMGSCAK